jgi:Zn-dependent protease with chaperone function
MRLAIALVTGLISAFFVFYTVRLLAVTSFLTHTRAGGGGAFIGAIVFPILAVLFGWVAVRNWRRSRATPANVS